MTTYRPGVDRAAREVDMIRLSCCLFLCALLSPALQAGDGNRLAYLDGADPYYVGRHFPRLITPQWVGEPGVEAVVILAIDDMRGHERWEQYLRPILNRLKKIDGRAPVSIMTCTIDPRQEHLQKWLKEGLSLETHTTDHPCPLLQKGDFAAARRTYESCVDLLASVPGSKPVAFRMPCCDSLNTPSPRFYAEIFNKTTSRGNFLRADSSVFNIITANDPELPRELVLENGQERFRKYVPVDRSFVNTIEDYPYPYVIGRLCWQFPCVTPSDWQAQHRHGKQNAATLRDWHAALDATVLKKGTFTLVFHPYDWIKNTQIIDLIDHAVTRHGKKLKFLNLREAVERLEKNLLGGHSLRTATGQDAGVRLLDLNGDGFLDVVIANDRVKQVRVWQPGTGTWKLGDFPVAIVGENMGESRDAGVRFGILHKSAAASILVRNDKTQGVWHYLRGKWVGGEMLLKGLNLFTARDGVDQGVRLRDLDGDGICELISSQGVFALDAEGRWQKLPFTLPSGTAIVDAQGRDAGLRFVDIDEDGHLDVMFSNEEKYSLHLFASRKEGWSRKVLAGKAGDREALPPIVWKGTNAGAWFHSRHLWVQNENTSLLPNLVDRRSFNQLLLNVEPTAKSPAASLKCLRPRPGFTAELMAVEPLVQDPIAFAWGPDGKLWVVEMGDYPLGIDGKGKFGGKVRFLEDTDGDGVYDRATVFLEGLGYPTGVLPWRKGVLVTCAPEIFYAEDTDGDGKADKKEVLFRGFVPGNQQHRVNTLAWGLDNWIHCANGDSGGRIQSVKTGKVVDIRGRDFRIRPDTGEIDAQTGQTQFGRCRDDWGHWFGGNNSNPMWHFVLADHYVRRNPHVAAPNLRVNVSINPGTAPVYPLSRTLARFNDLWAANRFTSACSPIIYRDDLFGPRFEGNAFISEPVHNLVHREVMSRSGVTFSSRRAEDETQSEFLASSDNWFRPTTLATGPDGALWVADMYRHVIEHPEWIPKETQKRLDLRAGHDLGRIYRVYPVGVKPRAIPRLDKLDSAGLVAALDSPSGWQRDTAQMMLLWRKDVKAVPTLEKLARQSKRPQARLHALCTLDGLDALKPELLAQALADEHWGVRLNAVRLCEGRLTGAKTLGEALLKMVDDPDPTVRLQLACTLGEWNDSRAGEALGKLALKDGANPYALAAVLSSLGKANLDDALRVVARGTSGQGPPAQLLERLLRLASALDHGRATATLLNAVTTVDRGGKVAAWQLLALNSLLENLEQRGSSLPALLRNADAELAAALRKTGKLFEAARSLAVEDRAEESLRLAAVAVLGRGLEKGQQDRQTLAGLLGPRLPATLQNAAAVSLARLPGDDVPRLLLTGWKGYSPALRASVLEALFRRPDGVKAILAALDSGDMTPADFGAAHRQRLLDLRDDTLRKRAVKLLAGAVDPDRQKVIESFASVKNLQGEPGRGAAIFKKSCAACHRIGEEGQNVGPDLGSLKDRSTEALLVAVLDPNRAVEARYVNYVVEMKNGLTYSGVLGAESGNAVTLVDAEGKPHVLLRGNIASLTATGKSAMPEGLEKDLKAQDLADLFAFLRTAGPAGKPKSFPGNRPELVRASGGTLKLTPANCSIYGKTLVLEQKYGNLGYWSSDDDQAVWTAEVPADGYYEVWLEWACEAKSAGNSYFFQAGEDGFRGKVKSTGDWDTYRREKIGSVKLSRGVQRFVLRPEGKIRSALMDLREIRLVKSP